jgi:hypothetical protein
LRGWIWVRELLTDLGDLRAMSRSARPPKIRPRSRGSLHTIIVVAAFLALGLFVNEEYLTKRPHAAQPVAIAPSDDEIYTGSILFMPPEGKICRQLLFDNRTGGFSDNGNVDCERAVYQGTGTKRWSTARLWAISRGFH